MFRARNFLAFFLFLYCNKKLFLRLIIRDVSKKLPFGYHIPENNQQPFDRLQETSQA